MALMFKTAFHLLCIANYAVIIYTMLTALPISRGKASFAGQWKFLTFLNLWAQLGYFAVAALNSLAGSEETAKKKSTGVQSVRDFIFATVAFPVGIFVSVTFWAIFFVDRELIFPKALDKIFPPQANHMMHTAPVLCQLLELWISCHLYPRRLTGALTLGTFSLGYLSLLCAIAYYKGFWAYPFLNMLPFWSRVAFFAASLAFMVCFYLGGELINNQLWKKSLAFEGAGDKTKGGRASQGDYLTRSKKKKLQKAD